MKNLGLMILMLTSLNLFAGEKLSAECSKIAQERESLSDKSVSSGGKETKSVIRN